MKNNSVLFLECRGCPFMNGDKIAKLSEKVKTGKKPNTPTAEPESL